MHAAGRPHPNSFRAGNEQIAALINFDSVRDAFTLSSRLLAEDAAIAQRGVGRKIIEANVSLLAVVHIEAFSVRGKRQAIWLGEVFGEQANVAGRIETKHALKWNFLRSEEHTSELQSR